MILVVILLKTKKMKTQQTDFEWMLEHWWFMLMLLFAWAFVFFLLFLHGAHEFIELGKTKETNPYKVLRTKTYWIWSWKTFNCKHENAELIENDRIFHCKDCNTKRWV